MCLSAFFFFFSSRRRHTRFKCDWSSDVCSSDLVPFTIKVLDSEEVNAFALPGGFFFVNSGLMLKADSESELAGVMAHEIAHVAARHGTRQQTKGQLINYATIPLIFMAV